LPAGRWQVKVAVLTAEGVHHSKTGRGGWSPCRGIDRQSGGVQGTLVEGGRWGMDEKEPSVDVRGKGVSGYEGKVSGLWAGREEGARW